LDLLDLLDILRGVLTDAIYERFKSRNLKFITKDLSRK